MKIGYFVEKFPYKTHFDEYFYGGGVIAAYNLAINMARRGYDISVFTTSADSKDSIEKYESTTIYRYGTKFQMLNRNISFSMLLKPQKHDVDIVHLHTTASPIDLLSALLYAKRKKKPLILTYHGDINVIHDELIYKLAISFYDKLIDKVLSYANVIISPSEYYIEESRFLKKYRDKIVVIPNGINIEEFDIPYPKEECREKSGLPLNENVILFVGVIHSHKGPDVLIKAMPKIIKEVSNTKSIFVGKEGEKGNLEGLEKLSKKLGVKKNIKFAGFVEGGLKPLYYKAADVFCLPSTTSHESFGIVNLEAMACGVPIVASKIGGVPDIVKEGENGLLVPPRDPEALAEAIIYLLKSEGVREKMGKDAREKIKDYSWERIAEETEKVYEEILE